MRTRRVRRPGRLNASLTGFLVAIMAVIIMATGLATFMSEMDTAHPTGNSSMQNRFQSYANRTARIVNITRDIENNTRLSKEPNFQDIIGATFRSGYRSLLVSLDSVNLFVTMMDDVQKDFPYFSLFISIFVGLILTLIFVGIVLAAVLKFRT